jgi:hypothetical protein
LLEDLLDLFHLLVPLLDLYHLLVPLLDLFGLFHHLQLDLLDPLADTAVYTEYRSLYRADKDQWDNTVYLAHMDYNMDYTTYLITSMFL